MPSITFCVYGRRGNPNSYGVNDMLLGCDFGIDGGTCLLDNVTVYSPVPNKMTCLRLNFGKNATILQKTKGEGYEYGYDIILYIPKYADVWLGVTDNNDLVVESDLNKRIIPGDYNHLILSKSIQQSLPDPFSNCEEKSKLLVKGSEINYRQVNCAEVCYNRVMTSICKCEFPEGCQDWSEDCSNANSFNKRSLINADCLNKCPLECNQVAFPVTRLNYNLEPNWVNDNRDKISTRFNITDHTDEEIRSQMACVTIYYDRLDTTIITQTPKTTKLDLICNIGGILGIFKYLFYLFIS